MTDLGPRIDVRDEFRADRAALLGLLRGLTPPQWRAVTAAAPWTVRDVVAHLLGDDLNRLSRSRDAHPGEGPAEGETLPGFLARINDEWVHATARLSPEVLVGLLESTTDRIAAFWAASTMDVLGEPVTWAGPDPAPVWLDCARDFTEYWTHAQQIREAAGLAPRTGGTHTVLDVFLRAMPHTLADTPRPDGTVLAVDVAGDDGGRWEWRCDDGLWRPVAPSAPVRSPALEPEPSGSAGAPLLSDEDGTVLRFPDAATLWKLCVRMLGPADAAAPVTITGDRDLANRALRIVSIVR